MSNQLFVLIIEKGNPPFHSIQYFLECSVMLICVCQCVGVCVLPGGDIMTDNTCWRTTARHRGQTLQSLLSLFIAPGREHTLCPSVCMRSSVCVFVRNWDRYRQKVRQKACACVCVYILMCLCISVSVCTRHYCPKQSCRPACVSWLRAQSLLLGC